MVLFNLITRLTDSVGAIIANAPLIALALLGLGFLIVFHEFGHFIFAKIFNVNVPSFSIGFGPRLIEKKIGETTFAISAIPLGGYVEMAGSPEAGQGEQELAHDTSERSFSSKPYWQKFLIISGGVLFNILFAYLALSFLFWLGAPAIGSWGKAQAPQIGVIHPDTPASKAGLEKGDIITAINDKQIKTIEELNAITATAIDTPVTMHVQRQGTAVQIPITIGKQKIGSVEKPLLGVSWQVPPMPFWQALIAGWEACWSLISDTFGALKAIFKTRGEGLGGPLMLIHQVTQFAGLGMKMFLFMLAFISVNLAVFNVLPLPIFDGGQLLFYTIEALTGRPLSERVRNGIHYASWLMVIALVLYLTFKDIIKIGGWS